MNSKTHAWKYARPQSNKEQRQTRHLMVCGPVSSMEAVDKELYGLGAEYIEWNEGASHCFSTYATPQAAAEAAAAVVARRQNLSTKFVEATLKDKSKGNGSTGDLPIPAYRTAEECGISGLILMPNFVSEEQEKALLDFVDKQPWVYLSRRRVQHYGRNFNYITRLVDTETPAAEFPPILEELRVRLTKLPGIGYLDQLTVNEYTPGVGLSPHVDTHSPFGDAILSLSVAGSAVMAFRKEGQRRAIFLPPRSLLLLTGESRFGWEHSIPHRKSDPLEDGSIVPRSNRRISFTFRRVRTEGPCRCNYPEFCESQGAAIPPSRMLLKLQEKAEKFEGEISSRHVQNTDLAQKLVIENCNGDTSNQKNTSSELLNSQTGRDSLEVTLEDKNVRDVYDAIAPHFGATRFAVWPKVKAFIQSLPKGSLVADVGCGNGKYFAIRRDIYVSGSDRSQGLVNVAARKLHPAGLPTNTYPYADVALADAMALPYREGSCDGVLSIAVLHHITTIERRIQFLHELLKALRCGGRALVTVWATEQENMDKVAKWERIGHKSHLKGTKDIEGSVEEENEAESHDYLVPWHLPLHRADAAAAATASATSNIDPLKNALVFRRYYHLFSPGELEALVERIPGAKVVDSFYDRDNWCVIYEKVC